MCSSSCDNARSRAGCDVLWCLLLHKEQGCDAVWCLRHHKEPNQLFCVLVPVTSQGAEVSGSMVHIASEGV